MSSETASAGHADTEEHPGLRERKKDATRRALAEAAMNLAIAHGYAAVTVADITEAVGVSRRTFSNYFPGKAECIAAASQGWFRDIAQSIKDAPPDHPLDQILREALLQFAADLPERWGKFVEVVHAEPELKAVVTALDEVNIAELVSVLAERLGFKEDDIRVRMLAAYGGLAGRTCLDDWVLNGRPAGELSFQSQLDLAFSIIDLKALTPLHLSP